MVWIYRARFKVAAETMSAKLANPPEGGFRGRAAGSRCGATERRTPWRGSTRWPQALGNDYERFEALVDGEVGGGEVVTE